MTLEPGLEGLPGVHPGHSPLNPEEFNTGDGDLSLTAASSQLKVGGEEM